MNNKRYWILLIIFLTIRMVFVILNRCFSLYFLFLKINEGLVNSIINIYIVLVVSILISTRLGKKAKCIVIFGIVLISSLVLYLKVLANGDISYFYFRAPGNGKMLIAEEDKGFMSGECRFYERKSNLFVKKLDKTIETDDGCNVFSQKRYCIKWKNNKTLELRYAFDCSDDIENYKKIVISLEE